MDPQGRRMVSQSPQTPNRQGSARSGSGAPLSRVTLNDVYAMVKSMESRMAAQETKLQLQEKRLQAQEEEIRVLKIDNSELWQEIHRLKGPRFPFEIFSLIILSTEEKKTLKTLSLVSRGWMSVTRAVLFKRISYSAMFWMVKIDPIPIMNSQHCTLFPYVQTIDISGSTDDGSEYPVRRAFDWMDGFLKFIPKFIALQSLELSCLDSQDLQGIQRSMPQSIKNNIKAVSIDSPECRMSELAVFVSRFTALKTLSWGGNSRYGVWELTPGLVSPPSSIRELSLWDAYTDNIFPLAVMKWIVNLHSGIIDSIDPYNFPSEKSVEFRRFLTRFGSTLSKIKFMISGDEGAVQFLRSGYCAALPQLKSIQLDFWGHTFSYSYFDKSFLSTIERLPKIIALLPPSIKEIILTMEPNTLHLEESAVPRHRLGSINWSQLDQSLTGSQYPLLRILTIRKSRYWRKEVDQDVEEMWRNLLPICARKGILKTDFRD
ncbi:hypothetical protein B0H11DRAFT_2195456 [Mycena galericulata]|nr:hypothetical protein B0H11DRAFT_2195456 [Mycena galericulata]